MARRNTSPPSVVVAFCARLKRLQQVSGLTQAELAKRAHLSAQRMSEILNGNVRGLPDWDLVREVVHACVQHASEAQKTLPEDLRDEERWRQRHGDRRTCEIGTIVSPGSSRAERAAAVYITVPYLSNRSPAWVTIWSRGIGPSTATLRLARPFLSFITNISGACRHRTARCKARCAAGPDRLRCKAWWSPATAPLIRSPLRDHQHHVSS